MFNQARVVRHSKAPRRREVFAGPTTARNDPSPGATEGATAPQCDRAHDFMTKSRLSFKTVSVPGAKSVDLTIGSTKVEWLG